LSTSAKKMTRCRRIAFVLSYIPRCDHYCM